MVSTASLRAAALLKGLGSYHDVLRRDPVHLYGPFRQRVLRDHGAVLVEWHWLQPMGADKLFRLAEAVHLLQLLAIVDTDGYYEELAAVWSQVVHEEPFGRFVDADLPIERHIGIQLGLWKSRAWYEKQLTTWTKRFAERPVFSKEFEAVCVSVGATMEQNVDVPVRVAINCKEHYGTELLTMLPLVATFVVSQPKRHPTSPSQIRMAMTELALDGVWYNMPADSILRIAQCGVRLSEIGVLHMAPVTHELHPERHRIRDTMIALLGIGQRNQEGTAAMVFSDSNMANMLVPVFSALSQAAWLEKLTISLTLNESATEGVWSWIAYALFSRHARHNIHELRIDLDGVKKADMEAFREVLQASNPLQAVRGLSKGCDYRSRRIVAKRIHLTRQSGDGTTDECTVFDSFNALDVEVLRGSDRGSGDCTVLLPGWGIAWVKRDDIIERCTESERRLSKPPGRSIPNLVITKLSDASLNEVIEFLDLIGCGLRSVSIESYQSSNHLDAFLRRLFSVCPRVHTLVVPTIPIKTLMTLVTHAQALRHLNLGKQLGIRTCHFLAMLEALSEPTHPFAKRMRSLSLHVMIRQRSDLIKVVSKLKALLESGTTLWYLRLMFRVTCSIDKQRDVGSALLRPSLAACEVPLALVTKLAFLSVVCHQTQTKSAICRLDAGVMANIFQFGARVQKRQVEIKFH